MGMPESADSKCKSSCFRSWSCLLIALAIIAVTAATAWLNEAGKASIDLSMNGSRAVYGLTTAISHYRFGSPLYSHYTPVLEVFWTNQTVNLHTINDLIAKAMAIAPASLTPDKLHVGFGELDYDDKGVILWYLAAFDLFGPHFGSIYALYFLLFAASISIFWLSFRNDPPALLLLPLFALVHLSLTTFVLAANPNVMGSLLGTRPFAMLGVLPTLHLALLMLRGRVLSSWLKTGVALQVAYLLFIITIRSSAEVELVLLMLIAGLMFACRFLSAWKSREVTQVFLRKSTLAQSFIWVPLSIFIGISASTATYKLTVPAEVRSKALVGHLLWHNMLGGFCLNTTLTNELFKYSLLFDSTYKSPPPPDGLAYSSIAGFFQTEFKNKHAMFGDAPDKRDVQSYERGARTLFFHMAQHFPKDVAHLFVVDKTKEFYHLIRVVQRQLQSRTVTAITFLIGMIGGIVWLRGLKVIAPLLFVSFSVASIPAYVFVPSTITMYDYAPYFYLIYLGTIATGGALVTWFAIRSGIAAILLSFARRAAPAAVVAIIPATAAFFLLQERLPTIGDRSSIVVLTATYGANVGGVAGSATGKLQHSCNGLAKCKYTIDADVLGDPKGGASKDFIVEYECSREMKPIKIYVPGEAHNARIKLDCTDGRNPPVYK